MKKIWIVLILSIFSNVIFAQHNNKYHTFASFDGTQIAYTDQGKGDAIILIHGFINDGNSWRNTILYKDLIDKGYRVIVPDLRGNGKSGKPQNPEAYQNNAEIQDLKLLADHLNLNSFIAIGYSRGSIILAKLLTEDKRIAKAVLGGMGFDFTNPEWPRRKDFADTFLGRTEPNELTKGAINYAKSIDVDLQILGYLQEFQPVTTPSELKQIDIPVLVISGNTDLDNGDPKKLHQNISDSKIIIVEGDHNSTYKQENFSIAVLNFLKGN